MMKTNLKAALLATALALGVSSANAASVESLFLEGFNTFNDRSGETVIPGANNDPFDPVNPRALQGGDIFAGAFVIDTLNFDSFSQLGGTSGNNELTGIFLAQINTISNQSTLLASNPSDNVSFNTPIADFSFGAVGQDVWDTFLGVAPSADFTLPNGADMSKAMILVFEDATPDMNFSSVANGFTTAGLGDGSVLRAALEIGDTGTSWDSYGTPVNPGDLANFNTTASDEIGQIKFALNFNYEGFGGAFLRKIPGFADDGSGGKILVDLAGTGGLLKPSIPNFGFPVRDRADMDVYYIPEPTTLALMGIGLLGLGALSRRRNKAA